MKSSEDYKKISDQIAKTTEISRFLKLKLYSSEMRNINLVRMIQGWHLVTYISWEVNSS